MYIPIKKMKNILSLKKLKNIFSLQKRYPPAVKNFNADCWSACGEETGACDFCGTQGVCCRRIDEDWPKEKSARPGSGCDGTNGGDFMFACTAPAVGGPTIQTEEEPEANESVIQLRDYTGMRANARGDPDVNGTFGPAPGLLKVKDFKVIN
jgi:hypothetical protein